MLQARLLGGLSAIAVLSASTPASAELSAKAYRNAYDYAVRCFAVAPLAKERGVKSDDGVKAYDTAQTLGAHLGYSVEQTDSDVRERASLELKTLVRDEAYLNKTLADCQRLKLLG